MKLAAKARSSKLQANPVEWKAISYACRAIKAKPSDPLELRAKSSNHLGIASRHQRLAFRLPLTVAESHTAS